MSEDLAAHSTFVIDRRLATSPTRAFSFWSDAALKQSWFACHDDWARAHYSLDFRIGGSESSSVVTPEGVAHDFKGIYLDIVEGRRIVCAYDMLVGRERISVSLATVLFTPAQEGALMTFTEQVVFFDGHADPQGREEGTEMGFERLMLEVERDAARVQ